MIMTKLKIRDLSRSVKKELYYNIIKKYDFCEKFCQLQSFNIIQYEVNAFKKIFYFLFSILYMFKFKN